MDEDKRNKLQRQATEQATEQEGSQLCNPKLSDTRRRRKRRREGEKRRQDEDKEKRVFQPS